MRHARWLALPVAIVVALPVGYLIDSARSEGRVLRGVEALGVPLAGLDAPAAARLLHERGDALLRQRHEVRVGKETSTIDPTQLGVRFETDDMARAAMTVGRRGDVATRFGSWIRRWVSVQTVEPRAAFDESELGRTLDGLEELIADGAPFEGAIIVTAEGPIASPPRPGMILDRPTSRRLLLGLILGQEEAPLALPLVHANAEHSPEAINLALGRARALIDGSVEISVEGREPVLRIEGADLAKALRTTTTSNPAEPIALRFDAERLAKISDEWRVKVESPAENARISADAEDRIIIEGGHPAMRVDPERLARVALAAAESPTRKAVLALSVGEEPALTAEKARALHLDGLTSSYTTSFACCQPRVKNIARIAAMLDNKLLMPGESLSINEFIGPRTQEAGFVMAPSIDQGEMVETYGGGVSQFATTLFNALFRGGYDVITRAPHSLYFSRYPVGYDATLSYPKPDLAFRNDSDAALLIKTEVKKTSVTVKLYGNNGGRTVDVVVSERKNEVEPPIEYIPNPKLTPDETKVKEKGQPGWSVLVARTITMPDGSSRREPREVTYKPRARRVEVHPCHVPEGSEGYTGEPCPKPEIASENEEMHEG